MTTSSPKEAVEARIYELAEQHGVVTEHVPLDDWKDKVTEQSGDDPFRSRHRSIQRILRKEAGPEGIGGCRELHGVCSASVIINILVRSRDPAPAATLQTPDALLRRAS